jgi:hypothetical protein
MSSLEWWCGVCGMVAWSVWYCAVLHKNNGVMLSFRSSCHPRAGRIKEVKKKDTFPISKIQTPT